MHLLSSAALLPTLTSEKSGSACKQSHKRKKYNQARLIPVGVALERALRLHSNVVSLLLGEYSEVGAKRWQMQAGDLLVQILGKKVDILLVALAFLPVLQEIELSKHLVGEGARHHERRVASGATKVAQSARCKHDDAMAIGEDESIDLWLDVLDLDARHLLKGIHFNLIVKVTNVANDRVVLHLLHALQGNDLEVASGCHEYVNLADDLLQGGHLEALHACLQGTDRVALCDVNTGTGAAQGEGAALADVAVAAHHGALASNHDISGAHDGVGERVAAAVDIVKLRLCHAVVDVDGWEKQLTLGSHLLQAVHTCGGLLTDALALQGHPAVLGFVLWDGILQELQDALELGVVGTGRVWQAAVFGILFLELLALVDQEGCITTIIHEEIAAILTRDGHHLLGAPPVLRKGLALPCKHSRCASLGNGRSGVILSAENIA